MDKESSKAIKIAVDVMGGDFAPNSEVLGALMALEAVKNDPAKTPITITLIGDKQKIEAILAENHSFERDKISIVDASEVITMHDDPVVALKTKRNSSMIKGIELHKEKVVDGFISAGNTGAMLTTATMILGRIDGVTRPTIGAFLPTAKNKPVFLIDIGATVDCNSRFLFEYAVIGSIFSKAILGVTNPSVGLLNVGSEDSKGRAEHIDTNKNLTASSLNFIGNIEGNDILLGKSDVVVTDGFTGNVLLKFAEGFLSLMRISVKQYSEKNEYTKKNAEIISPVLKDILGGFNYEEYGGTPLLGVKGTVIIGHGSSTPKAIMNMIFSAVSAIEKGVCSKIESAFKEQKQQ